MTNARLGPARGGQRVEVHLRVGHLGRPEHADDVGRHRGRSRERGRRDRRDAGDVAGSHSLGRPSVASSTTTLCGRVCAGQRLSVQRRARQRARRGREPVRVLVIERADERRRRARQRRDLDRRRRRKWRCRTGRGRGSSRRWAGSRHSGCCCRCTAGPPASNSSARRRTPPSLTHVPCPRQSPLVAQAVMVALALHVRRMRTLRTPTPVSTSVSQVSGTRRPT